MNFIFAMNSVSAKEDLQNKHSLMLAVSELFDEMELKINNESLWSLDEELVIISTIYRLFRKLMKLRTCCNLLDRLITDLESTDENDIHIEGRNGFETVDSLSKLTEPSAENCISGDDLVEPNLRDKVACICIICNKEIVVRDNCSIEFAMEEHLQSLHPLRSDPVDYASYLTDDDENVYSIKSEKEGSDESTVASDASCEEVKSVKDDPQFEASNTGCQGALKNIASSNGIFIVKKDKFCCYVCDGFLPREVYVGHHVRSKCHRHRVQRYKEFSENVKKDHLISVDPDIFIVLEGKLFCSKCGIFLPNQHIFLTHVSEAHGQKLKLDFSIIKLGSLEFCALCDIRIKEKRPASTHLSKKTHYVKFLQVTTIVQLKNVKFCSLCSVKLFTESQFTSHTNDVSHISNLENIDSMV